MHCDAYRCGEQATEFWEMNSPLNDEFYILMRCKDHTYKTPTKIVRMLEKWTEITEKELEVMFILNS